MAPVSARRRVAALIPMAVAGFLASFWWVGIVALIPADQRPFIGGSTDGTAIQLLFGYDGLGWIFGRGGGAPGGGGPGGAGGGGGGSPGILRLFNEELGAQVAWLIPLALVGLGAGLLVHLRAGRTDPQRAAYILWGGWFFGTAAVFSLMSGIIHSYDAVVLAPAIGVLVGAGVVELWARRSRSVGAGLVLAGGIVATAICSAVLLTRTPSFLPGIDIVMVVVAVAAAVVIAFPEARHFPRLSRVAAAVALGALLVGPSAYARSVMHTGFSGGDPSATLTADGGQTGPGGQRFGGQGFGPDGPLGAVGAPGVAGVPGAAGAVVAGGAGGAVVNRALYDYLLANRGTSSWAVAVQGAEQAAAIELATGLPVMAMGGFSGSDPTPTVAQLQAYVASRQLRFVIVGGGGPGGGGPGGGGPGGGRGGSSAVTSWVTTNGTLVASIRGVSLYDLSATA